jgi:hypothetical protein
MSPIQRGELENIVNAQIAAIVVLSRHLKWIKSSSPHMRLPCCSGGFAA